MTALTQDSPRSDTKAILALTGFLCIVLAASSPVVATDKCGAVCDEAWTTADSPYVATCDVTIAAGCSLTIEAGVAVRFQTGAALEISGTLEVNPTSGSTVTLTSDDVAPSSGDWPGLDLGPGSTGTIRNTEITYANYGVYTHGSASVVLIGVTSRLNNQGLRVYGSGGSPTVTASACAFTENLSYGVDVGQAGYMPVVAISDSSIHSNSGQYDYYLSSSFSSAAQTVLDMRSNWWGTSDPLSIVPRIYDHSLSTSRPIVDWCDYLDGPGGSPVRDVYCPDLAVCDETVVWDQTDKPYQLVSDLVVCQTGTLQIEPGVEVRTLAASQKRDFLVQGTLDVNGIPGTPVLLTSDAPVPQTADWPGLDLGSGSTSTIDGAEITYADNGIYAHGNASVTLNGSSSRLNNRGLRVYGSGGSPTVNATDCVFMDNASYGVDVGQAGFIPVVTITGSSIHSNSGQYDYYLSTSFTNAAGTVLDARNNWWGTPDPLSIVPRIYDHSLSGSRPMVDWCGYLDAPGGSPVRDVHCPDLAVCDETVVWNLTDKPYQLVSDLVVCPTGTLQIDAGVEVRTVAAGQKRDFLVQGTLDVNGLPGAPVALTSDAPAPQTADWPGLDLGPGSTSTIDGAEITYADNGIYAHGNASVTLNGSSSRLNNRGLRVYGSGGSPTVNVTDCVFTDNASYGVDVGQAGYAAVLAISDSSIHSNSGQYDYYVSTGFSNPTQTALDARNNWWGTTDPLSIVPRIYDHSLSGNRPMVDWCGYLDGPGGSAVRDVHCPDLAVCGETVVWDQTDKPYQLVSDLVVCPTGTLQIEPGVEVRTLAASQKRDFLVQGTLDVNGTPGTPVSLTSDAAGPQTADWTGLDLGTGSMSTIDGAVITYADYGIYAHGNASVTLNGVSSRLNNRGLRVYGSGGSPTVSAMDCIFTDNASYGVDVGQAGYISVVAISDSSIHSNSGQYDYYVSTGFSSPTQTALEARDNWWGTPDPLSIVPRIYDHSLTSSRPMVDWCGYLDGPGGSPVRDVYCPDLAVCDETVVWDQTDKPYQLVSDLVVCPTGTLQIEAGVELRTLAASQKRDFLVQGTLDVNGAPGTPVVLTSDAPGPQTADWPGLDLTNGSTSTIDHAEISYADSGVYVHGDAVATLFGVTSHWNNRGLHVFGSGGLPVVDALGCVLTDNALYGVEVGQAGYIPSVTITSSSIHSNSGLYDYYLSSAFPDASVRTYWATDNWWGTTSEAAIEERILDHDDMASRPTVYYRAFGESCELALGTDLDVDGSGDFEDNCPLTANAGQSDSDGDRMGDTCDPDPQAVPASDCDGLDDELDGWLDSDADGWGNPCDFQPTRGDSYPGAPEICDGRDNDGDVQLGFGETTDDDRDLAVACGDCDDLEPEVFPCACEFCNNTRDDDCDTTIDEADSDCQPHPYCVTLAADAGVPSLHVGRGSCGGVGPFGFTEVIRGLTTGLRFTSGSVDLGQVDCVASQLAWDRVTDLAADPNPACDPGGAVFYLAKYSEASDYGASAPNDEPRDVMSPDPACP